MINTKAANYFKTLNPLAERISGDIENIKTAYNSIWDNLSLDEQEQIINDSIIHPEILLNYSTSLRIIYEKSGCKIKTGTKIVTDDTSGHTWLDEHSSPFSWKSRSLLEICNTVRCVPSIPIRPISVEPLTTLEKDEKDEPDSDVNNSNGGGGVLSTFCARLKSLPTKSYEYGCNLTHSIEDKGILSKFKKDAVVKLQSTFKIMSGRVSGPCGSENDTLVVKGGATIVPRSEKNSCIVAKPNTAPPPPPRVLLKREVETPLLENEMQYNVDHVSETDDKMSHATDGGCENEVSVPKSGFDFLDNW